MTNTRGYVEFWTLPTVNAAAADSLIGRLHGEFPEVLATAGFRSARLHVGFDTTTVLLRLEWSSSQAHDSFRESEFAQRLRLLDGRAGVTDPRCCGGELLAPLCGPDAGRSPEVVVLAVRHVGNRRNALALLETLENTRVWKHDFSGFISAQVAISADGATFINYPQWTSKNVFEAFVADPRNAAGQPDIARLEAAEPEILPCYFRSEVARSSGNRE
ncbi:hypothetical protein [Amycolatopsis sp. H20-H5]|uniref:hypothetical protein n=1 Tax=Amycolatopsis sp. H20-H5 TaxID=3046309 RepID=UPI002DBFB7FE|nr:hypothetical protein [Amycolatopsis sp. H20-H5]MEC3975521.1 hypothetical protein [Amycolatopsis sp. H20-H5]